MTPTIVLDFDGTLALGTGPIAAFARAIADGTGDAGFAERALAAIAQFEEGVGDARDGYDAVTRIAVSEGVSPAVLGAAYDLSRAQLGTDRAPVRAPDGLARFLGDIRERARLVLATNAPGDGIRSVLGEWGALDAFDELHFAVGKPEGLVPILRAALGRGRVLSVGDIFAFDLAPAAALGADTALVGATAARTDEHPTLRGRTLADLYEPIGSWVAS